MPAIGDHTALVEGLAGQPAHFFGFGFQIAVRIDDVHEIPTVKRRLLSRDAFDVTTPRIVAPAESRGGGILRSEEKPSAAGHFVQVVIKRFRAIGGIGIGQFVRIVHRLGC